MLTYEKHSSNDRVSSKNMYTSEVLSLAGARGAIANPDFGRSVNPISTRLYPPNNTGTPGFSVLPTALYLCGLNSLRVNDGTSLDLRD